jgi:hypothetical protein
MSEAQFRQLATMVGNLAVATLVTGIAGPLVTKGMIETRPTVFWIAFAGSLAFISWALAEGA